MVSTLTEQQIHSSENDDRFINTIIEEREPGVYVRSQNPNNRELDFLWENGQTKRVYDSSRNSIGYFLAGTVTGAIITLVLCLAVLSINHFLSGPKEQIMAKPTVNTAEEISLPIKEEAPVTETKQPVAETKPVTETTPIATVEKKPEPVVHTTPVATPATKTTTSTRATAAKTHSVQNGETIGSIAYEYYGDSSPKMVERIQAANGLKNVHSIQIGQKLVIPAKD